MLWVSVVGWSDNLVLGGIVCSLLHFSGVDTVVVISGEDTVVRNLVVVAGWLEVVQVGEGGGVDWGQVLDLV